MNQEKISEIIRLWNTCDEEEINALHYQLTRLRKKFGKATKARTKLGFAIGDKVKFHSTNKQAPADGWVHGTVTGTGYKKLRISEFTRGYSWRVSAYACEMDDPITMLDRMKLQAKKEAEAVVNT